MPLESLEVIAYPGQAMVAMCCNLRGACNCSPPNCSLHGSCEFASQMRLVILECDNQSGRSHNARNSAKCRLENDTRSCRNIWVCLKMLCTPKPNGFADHYPYEKWLFHWGYTPFSDIPIYHSKDLMAPHLRLVMEHPRRAEFQKQRERSVKLVKKVLWKKMLWGRWVQGRRETWMDGLLLGFSWTAHICPPHTRLTIPNIPRSRNSPKLRNAAHVGCAKA